MIKNKNFNNNSLDDELPMRAEIVILLPVDIMLSFVQSCNTVTTDEQTIFYNGRLFLFFLDRID